MFYGIYSDTLVIPDSLYPSHLTRLETPVPGGASRLPEKEDNSGKYNKTLYVHILRQNTKVPHCQEHKEFKSDYFTFTVYSVLRFSLLTN